MKIQLLPGDLTAFAHRLGTSAHGTDRRFLREEECGIVH